MKTRRAVTVYHGTSEKNLRNILKCGLRPRKRKNHAESGDYVYVEKSARAARWWATQAGGMRVAVLEIEIPEDALTRDGQTLSQSAFKTGNIPASSIKGWDIYKLNASTGDWEFENHESNPAFGLACA